MQTATSSDQAIILTADDAILAKQATVDSGYYKDPFLASFSSSAVGLSGPSKDPSGRKKHHQPLIKRGTHARVSCIDRGITAFLNLKHESIPQIVVLGAGLDTTFLRYSSGLLSDTKLKEARWYEVDHPGVIKSKATTISQSNNACMQKVDVTPIGCGFLVSIKDSSLKCFMLGHDLRLTGVLDQLHGFDKSSPTLFVMECVLMYLPADNCRSLCETICQTCPQACVLLYDPILGQTPFGRVMEDHLRRAKVITNQSSMVHTRTVSAHLHNLVACGFREAVGCDMWNAYQTVLTTEQRQRANACEFLDEIEEWVIIMRHYCIVMAGNCDSLADLCQVGSMSPLGFQEGMCENLHQ